MKDEENNLNLECKKEENLIQKHTQQIIKEVEKIENFEMSERGRVEINMKKEQNNQESFSNLKLSKEEIKNKITKTENIVPKKIENNKQKEEEKRKNEKLVEAIDNNKQANIEIKEEKKEPEKNNITEKIKNLNDKKEEKEKNNNKKKKRHQKQILFRKD